MASGSKKTVIVAVSGNIVVCIAKFIGYFLSGSSAMLAEAVHSLADSANQGLLLIGIIKAEKTADDTHHFGYGQERYFWNLISATMIFFLGCVYTIMHAVGEISKDGVAELSVVAFSVIGLSFVMEGTSWYVAAREFNKQRLSFNMKIVEYLRESKDLSTIAVLVEDTVAVIGLVLALAGMSISAITGNSIFDGVAAILIGLLMGFLAYFLATSNKKFLINASDPDINESAGEIWGADDRVQRVNMINTIVITPDQSIVMAELELREESIFENMSQEEQVGAIRFMERINAIRIDLEEQVRRDNSTAHQIFIEFVDKRDSD